MKKIAYKEMYEYEFTHPWYQITRMLMINTLKKTIDKKSKILDVGCGTGGTAILLKKQGFNNVFGIDSSNVAIGFCKKRGLKNIKISRAENIPYASNYFDVVICLDVLYHLGIDRNKTLKEINRVLKPEGLFYSQEPSYDWLRSRHDIAIETGKRFKINELKQLLQKSDFELIKISHFNAIFLPLIILKRYKDKVFKSKSSSSDVNKLPLIMSGIFKSCLLLETYIYKITNMPFGLSIITIAKKI